METKQLKKIGELVSDSLNELFNDKIVSKLEVELMETKTYSTEIFSITYPLLINEDEVDEKKNKRYWKDTVSVYGVNYRICNDWYENKKKNQRPKFECWLDLKQLYRDLNKDCKKFIENLRNKELSETNIISLLKIFYNNGKIKTKVSKDEIGDLHENKINKFLIKDKENFYTKEDEYYISDKIKQYIDDEKFRIMFKESIDMLEYNIKTIKTEKEDRNIEEKEVTKVKNKIELIRYYIQNSGFKYDYNQIINIYASLKTKPFVILSGISGTGKSKLVKLLAESLGATSQNGRFTLIPVRPDWSDSSELLGHKDLNGTFHPGILTTVIEKALNDKQHLYFICLDEMNLARVEYYLSDILSVIESRDRSEDGEIKTDHLIRKELLGNDQDAIQKYSEIYIPENLYIIGTVNMDETTFPFSKKVLDRANTIEFNEVNLEFDFDLFDEEEEILEQQEYTNSFLKSKYIKLLDCKEEKEQATQIINQLIKINNVLEKYSQHFGYRVRDEIVYYCLYALADELFTLEEAMDYCIVQKILPKIGGSDEDTLDLLIDLYNNLNNTNYTRDDLDNDRVIKPSDKYKLTNKKILIMVRRFVRDGFTNFWQ